MGDSEPTNQPPIDDEEAKADEEAKVGVQPDTEVAPKPGEKPSAPPPERKEGLEPDSTWHG